jgi:MoxR-like ATPase
VSADGVTRKLPDPFMVAATMNPIEYEGTYTLPEAQLDRFLLKLVLDLPPRDAEVEVLRRHAAGFNPRDLGSVGVQRVLGASELQQARAQAQQVQVSGDVLA